MATPARPLLFLSLLFAVNSWAADAPLELTRLSGPIVVDGVPDEPAWQNVPALPMTMYSPIFQGQPSQRTEIRVAYDDEHLYAAGWFFDREPDGIRINSLYRDRFNGDDSFALYIDTFNDDQNGKLFLTTPAGIRFDQLLSDDGTTLNDNWDTFWTAKATVTREGWFAEMRIPFSTLGFVVNGDGGAVMGLTATRLVSRTGERVTFPAIDPAFPFRRSSLARDVVLRGARSRTPVYFTPYTLAGLSRNAVATTQVRKNSQEAGLDIRYPVSSKLTVDLTVNTDFAQVEADGQQVALDRFPLFFPERRRFFQEGSGIFNFVTAGGARLFHSRRIGLTEEGTPLRILGGARVVGRVGQWDVGFLEMQTAAHGDSPSENFGVLRMRRPVLNSSSTTGFMLTSYLAGDHYNVAAAADTVLRLYGNEYLSLRLATTMDDEDGEDLVSRSLVDAKWERRTGRGLSYNWQFSRAGADYRPELGFLPRIDYTTANVGGNYFIFTDKSRYFRRVYPGAIAFSTFRNSDGKLESGQYAVWVQWDTKAEGGGWVEPKWFHEDVVTPFTIGRKVHIPAGSYDFADLQIVYSMPAGAKLRADVNFRTGTYFDGKRTQVLFTPTWNASRHLELGADYQLTSLRFDKRNEAVDIHLVGLRILTALNARASGNALVQYNSTTDRLDFNVRLRYAMAEGTDLWLVYNEGLDADRSRDHISGPNTPTSLSRALILKYTHTFSF